MVLEWLSPYLKLIDELRRRVIIMAGAIGALFIICITFELRPATVLGLPLAYLYPNAFDPIAIQFFRKMRDDLVPATVGGQPITTAVMAPLDAMMVEIKVALFLSIAIAMPVIVYQLGKFLSPALKSTERRLLVRIAAPSALLFIAGAVFAYMFVVPFVFEFMYSIAGSMVDQMFLSPSEFIDFTLTFLFGFGLAFELPILMIGLCALGILSPDFWKRNWRYATVAIFVFAAVITPDGSGVTMMIVAIPMLFLYIAGYLISKYKYGKRKERWTQRFARTG